MSLAQTPISFFGAGLLLTCIVMGLLYIEVVRATGDALGVCPSSIAAWEAASAAVESASRRKPARNQGRSAAVLAPDYCCC